MNCETCKEKETQGVPYVVYESAMARNERGVKRLLVALLVAVVLLFASNAAWLYAWTRYDYSSTEISQDGEGINIVGERNMVGEYGAESTS